MGDAAAMVDVQAPRPQACSWSVGFRMLRGRSEGLLDGQVIGPSRWTARRSATGEEHLAAAGRAIRPNGSLSIARIHSLDPDGSHVTAG